MSKENILNKEALVAQTPNKVSTQESLPLGFEDEDAQDMIIPRVKIIQSLSPERKDKIAEEGDIINSLTKEKLMVKHLFQYSNLITMSCGKIGLKAVVSYVYPAMAK